MQYDDTNPGAVDVMVAELLVATADHADAMVHPAVHEVLGLLRDKMNMDVVFVRVFRPGLAGAATADPLEASWGQQVLGERMLNGSAAGQHQSAPVVLADGSVYGTLCTLSQQQWAIQRESAALRSTAQLIAHKIGNRAGTRRKPAFAGDTTLPLESPQPA
jgi:hypothetical protein